MANMKGKYFKVLIFLCYTAFIETFSFDTKVPIIKEGTFDSFFGFSVAQHQISNPSTGASKSVFLVGAPRDNITNANVDPSVSALSRPGAVYSCELSSYRDDCTWIRIDAEEPQRDEQKDGQWMGVSLASQGTEDGGAVACAHRYTKGRDEDQFRWGLGQCISMTNTLDEDNILLPCVNLPKNELHSDYGLCQSGASVALDKEGDILIGAPGSRNWRGSAFKNTIMRSLDADYSWYQSPTDQPDETNPGPEPAVRFYSYLGMSTQIATLNGDQKSYITGAPRSEDVGQVLLFALGEDALTITKRDYLNGEQFGSWFGCDFTILDINNDGKNDLVVGAPFYNEDEIGGAIYVYLNSQEGINSNTVPQRVTNRKMPKEECKELDCENARFGFSVERIGDIDMDGYEDLAVGAPFEGSGVVYIFRGQEDGLAEEYSQRLSAEDLLTAGSKLESFGYSLSGGMDMDNNGYPDLVVGNYGADMAMVLRSRPVVKVQAVMAATPTTIDPTLTRCEFDGNNKNCFKVKLCFNFSAEPKSSFTEELELDYRLEAEIFTGKRFSRVSIKGSKNTEEYATEKSIVMFDQFQNKDKCKEHTVYISTATKDFLTPIQFKLTYKLADKEMQVPIMNEGDSVPDINSYPILDEASAKVNLAVPFKKNCGTDDVCKSDLSVRASFRLPTDEESNLPILKVGQVNELKMEVYVRNLGEDAHESNIYITLPEHVDYVGTRDMQDESRAGPTCNPTTATRTQWACDMGNPLREDQSQSFIVRMSTDRISPQVRRMTFSLKANTTSMELNEPDNTFEQEIMVVVESNLQLRGSSDPSEVFYSGEVRGESDIEYEDEIGSQVMHTYVMSNTMSGSVKRSQIIIRWPYEVMSTTKHGKHLLYLMEPPGVNKPDLVECSIQEGFEINPAGIEENFRYSLKYETRVPVTGGEGNYTVEGASVAAVQPQPAIDGDNEEDMPRRRRKREDVIRAATIKDGSGKELQVVTMDCRKDSARCFDITCDVKDLEQGDFVVIRLRSRLWNHTFVEDYRNVDRVEIFSSARLEIDPALNIKETTTGDNTAEAKTRAIPDIRVAKEQGIPWWVILIAVIGGIILLAIIIVVLYFCGFFRRKRPDDIQRYKGKLEKKKYEDDQF